MGQRSCMSHCVGVGKVGLALKRAGNVVRLVEWHEGALIRGVNVSSVPGEPSGRSLHLSDFGLSDNFTRTQSDRSGLSVLGVPIAAAIGLQPLRFVTLTAVGF